MKSLFVTSGAVLYALSMAACMADGPPASPASPANSGDEAGDPATVTESKAPDVMDVMDVMAVPPDLSFAQLPEGTVVGNQFNATTNACRVVVVDCADLRLSPHYPSFCQSQGGCGLDHGFAVARSLCHLGCRNINCNSMYYLGGC
jgi:hypothetical protein